METQNLPFHQKTKGLRKGTHSCLECRKRKIRCVWHEGSDICETCTVRKWPCTQQTYDTVPRAATPKTKRMRHRIADLEGALRQIVQRLEESDVDSEKILKGVDLDNALTTTRPTSPS